MTQEKVRLCEVCWKDNITARANWYLSTIPVCDDHYGSVCARCRCRWAAWYVQDGDGYIFACDECCEELERQAARREAYNKHLSSAQWRKTKNLVRSQSRRELGKVACLRCGMTERENKQTYGEGLHGHHATYERFGHEKADDVVLLCSRCHAWDHRLPEPKHIKSLPP